MSDSQILLKKENKEGPKAEMVHVSTEQKSELTANFIDQLDNATEYLSGEWVPNQAHRDRDAIHKALTALGEPSLKPFLELKQWKVMLVLPQSRAARAKLIKELKKDSYMEVGPLTANKGMVEVTNPYYVPPALARNAPLAKKSKKLLEEIRNSGNLAAMTAAHGCFTELRAYLSARELRLEQAGKAPPWAKEQCSLMAEACQLLANNMVKRLEHIQKYVRSTSTEKLTFPSALDAEKIKAKKKYDVADASLFENATGKNAMKRIEWGIKQNMYSLVEVAFYEQVKGELAALFSEINESGLAEKDPNAVTQGKSEKVALAYNYVEALETMAWKPDLHTLWWRLKSVAQYGEKTFTEKHPSLNLRHAAHTAGRDFSQAQRRAIATIGQKFFFSKKRTKKNLIPISKGEIARARLAQKMRTGKFKDISATPEQMGSAVSVSRSELMDISRKAGAYCKLLEEWISNNLPQFSSDEKKEFTKQFAGLRRQTYTLARKAKEFRPKSIILPPKDSPYWEELAEINNIEGKPLRDNAHLMLSSKYAASQMIPIIKEYETSISRPAIEIGNRLLRALEIKSNNKILLNENESWPKRVAAFNRIAILDQAVPILAGTTLLGAGMGSLAGPVGTKGGAALGYGTGLLVVGAAGTFNSGDAIRDYINSSTEKEEQLALSNLRSSAFYMGFGIGGGPLRFFSGTAAKAVSATAFGGLAASHAVLVVKDVEKALKGDSSAYWDIPVDVAFIAIGSVGFLKTLQGPWKTIKLPKYMRNQLKGKSLIAGSFGFTEQQLGAKLPKIIARAVGTGYSPGFVALNSGFSLAANLPKMEEAISRGEYRQAFSAFSTGFREMATSLVAFDFVIIGGGGKVFRIMRKIPRKFGRRIKFLQADGLHSRITESALEGGAKLTDAKAQESLIEIAFGRGRKFSPKQIQGLLGLEGEAGAKAAKAISADVRESWALATEAFPIKGGKAVSASVQKLKAVWEKARLDMLIEWARRQKALQLVQAAAPRLVIPGVLATSMNVEYSEKKHQLLENDMAKYLDPQEIDFRNFFLRVNPDAKYNMKSFGISEFKFSDVLDAFEEIGNLGYSGKITPKEKIEKRLRISCALALLMAGTPASHEQIELMADAMKGTLERIGINPADRIPVDALALMAYTISKTGAKRFVKNYENTLDRFSTAAGSWVGMGTEADQDAFASNIVGLYAAAALGKGPRRASDISARLLAKVMDHPLEQRSAVRGWPLLLAVKDDVDGLVLLEDSVDSMVHMQQINIPIGMIELASEQVREGKRKKK